MIDLGQKILDLKNAQERLDSFSSVVDVKGSEEHILTLKAEQEKENFWNELAHATKINKEIRVLEKKVDKFKKIQAKLSDLIFLAQLCLDLGELSEEDEQEIISGLSALEKDFDDLEVEVLLRGAYDSNNAILTLHAGAGGTEAQDWVDMLFRMYTRYAESQDYKIEEIDRLPGDEAGIKSITFMISGDNAYGYLKAEKGVHRLVRISPFDANGRRHTSFASLEVLPEIIDDEEVTISSDDIRVDKYRSSGAGGQHVNKTESAIRITHIPTGIVVQCQNERSQIQNKEKAMLMLKSKLAELREREQLEKKQAIKGEIKKIEWGSQIRSYVFCPYTMVKDHRTNYEMTDVQDVMNGNIDGFIKEYLKKS